MIRPINKDIFSLGRKSVPADKNDINVIADLKDTLAAHREECVGMAANMIGVNKNIIIVDIGYINMIMINPKIIRAIKPYTHEEGCLSLDGKRSVKRFKEIDVSYEDEKFNKCQSHFSGIVACIIQHEIDHCNGVII
ncbi:MAG: peptide deformylase [Clostridia bacterium]|nr:peptide deformylase [Clostridia bacterium]